MTSVHRAIRAALETRLAGLEVCRGGPWSDIAATATGFERATGSFLADGFEPGDTVIAQGFAVPGGPARIAALSALVMTLDRPRQPEPAGAPVEIVAGLPEHRRFEGQPFKPPAHLPWVKATLLPEGGAVVAWGKGGLVRQRGALRVDLFGPIEDGLGLARLERLSDALLAWFARGTALPEGPLLVRVLGVQREPFREEPGGLVVAVRIAWFCDMTE